MLELEERSRFTASRDVLWTRTLSQEDAAAYDRFVGEAPSGHFMQTRAWANVAQAGRPCQVRYFMVRDAGRILGAALVLRTSVGLLPLPVASVERGPVCASLSDLPRVLAALSRAALRHSIAHLRVMPYWANDDVGSVHHVLAASRFQDVQRFDGSHVVTLRLDIDGKTNDTMFAGKANESMRQRFQQAERAGASARRGGSADFEIHRRLSGKLMTSQGRHDKSEAWYKALETLILTDPSRGALFVCEHEGVIVSTVVVMRHGAIATYVYGATSDAPLKFTKTILALRAAVQWARDEGCKVFDLGGIAMDEDKDPKRASLEAFKLHLTKTRVHLVHEHARWF